MLYYKVNHNADNIQRHRVNSKKVLNGDIWVKDELLTPCEVKQYANYEKYTTPVNVNKNRTYWFFGCRFAE